MLKKTLIFIPLLYFFALLQTSFLVPYLVLISVIFINLFEQPKDFSGIFAALAGGFFLDIFSGGLLGANVLILLAASIFIKIVFKRYVQVPVR